MKQIGVLLENIRIGLSVSLLLKLIRRISWLIRLFRNQLKKVLSLIKNIFTVKKIHWNSFIKGSIISV